MTEHTPEMVGLREASRRSGLSYDYLRKACLNGEIVHIRTGRNFVVNYDKLCEMLNTAGLKAQVKRR